MSMAKIGVISLGCAKNQVNCEQMMYRLQEAGHESLPDVTGADVVLINTCGFIDSAKSEAIDHIIAMGQLKEAGVVGKILVTGCLSQRYQKEILEEMPEVDALLWRHFWRGSQWPPLGIFTSRRWRPGGCSPPPSTMRT